MILSVSEEECVRMKDHDGNDVPGWMVTLIQIFKKNRQQNMAS